jgi:dUTP pyrophosphatase
MNTQPTIKFVKVRDVKSPDRGTTVAAGIDFYVPNDYNNCLPFTLQPGYDLLIKSGIRAKLPEGTMLMAAEKSGIATSKTAIRRCGSKAKASNPDSPLLVGAKIVDEDYQGEIGLHIINVGTRPVDIYPGQKIVQFILTPVYYPILEEFEKPEDIFNETSERGEGGFGSTGVQ